MEFVEKNETFLPLSLRRKDPSLASLNHQFFRILAILFTKFLLNSNKKFDQIVFDQTQNWIIDLIQTLSTDRFEQNQMALSSLSRQN